MTTTDLGDSHLGASLGAVPAAPADDPLPAAPGGGTPDPELEWLRKAVAAYLDGDISRPELRAAAVPPAAAQPSAELGEKLTDLLLEADAALSTKEAAAMAEWLIGKGVVIGGRPVISPTGARKLAGWFDRAAAAQPGERERALEKELDDLRNEVQVAWCTQCGQWLWQRACGPTHAVRWAELQTIARDARP